MTSPRTLTSDTSPAAESAWIAVLRGKGPSWRMARMMEWSATVRAMAMAAFDRRHPDASAVERRDWMLRQCYGDELADRYAAAIRVRGPA